MDFCLRVRTVSRARDAWIMVVAIFKKSGFLLQWGVRPYLIAHQGMSQSIDTRFFARFTDQSKRRNKKR
jgi:hypothetical protein